MINDAVKSMRSAQILLIVILGFSVAFWVERNNQLNELILIERLLIKWDLSQQTTKSYKEDYQDGFDIVGGLNNVSDKMADMMTLYTYLATVRTLEHHCAAILEDDGTIIDDEDVLFELGNYAADYYFRAVPGLSYAIYLSENTCGKLKEMIGKYTTNSIEDLVEDDVPLISGFDLYEPIRWSDYIDILKADTVKECEEYEWSKKEAAEIIKSDYETVSLDVIRSLQNEALPYVSCVLDVEGVIFEIQLTSSSGGFSGKMEIVLNNMVFPPVNADGESDPYPGKTMAIWTEGEGLVNLLRDANSKVKYLGNDALNDSDKWFEMYRALKVRYENQQLIVPVLSINVGYKNALVLTCGVSTALLYWLYFLLGSIRRAALSELDTPWAMSLFSWSASSGDTFATTIRHLEAVPFLLFFLVSVLSPLVPAVILMFLIDNEEDVFEFYFLVSLLAIILTLIVASLYRKAYLIKSFLTPSLKKA